MARRKIETVPEVSKRVDSGEMRIVYMPLSELERWPRNPKEHDFEYLEASFKRFGFVAPPTIDETSGRLVAGHGRIELLSAAKAAGKAPPNGIRVIGDLSGAMEWLVPVLRGVAFANETEAEAWLISDNEGPALGGWKDRELLEMLDSHRENLEGTGFDLDRIEELSAKLAALSEDIPEIEAPEKSSTKDLAYEDRYAIVVSCTSEADQKETFEKLRDMGLETKARYWRVAAKVTSG